MRTEDQLPSTFDLPPIAGGQEDEVLATMENAMRRVESDWTCSAYMTPAGKSCAVGALGFEALGHNLGGSFTVTQSVVVGWIEGSAVVKEALALVNEAAVELFPWSGELDDEYTGPLERVNQLLDDGESSSEDWEPEDDQDESDNPALRNVLAVYQHAIDKRRGLVPA